MREGYAAVGYVDVLYFENGELKRKQTFKNRLTYHAVATSARLWLGESLPTPTKIVLGTGTPPPPLEGPTFDDTELWNPDPATERRCDIRTTFLTFQTEFGVNFRQGELTGTVYTEAGLFDDEGNMWAHAIVNIDQAPTESAVLLWKIQHIGD